MKVVYLTVVLLLVTGSVRSQFKLNKPGLSPLLITAFNITGQPSAKSGKGFIYTLPQDNMPCFVPFIPFGGSMPVYIPFVENLYIHNPYFKKDRVGLTKIRLDGNNYNYLNKSALELYNKSRDKKRF